MKLKSLISLIFLFPLLLIGSPPKIYACMCSVKPSICSAYNTTDAIFIGKAVGTKLVTFKTNRYKKYIQRTKFQIIESYSSEKPKDSVYLYTEIAGCGSRFKKGKTYLVYAYKNDGMLSTHSCTRTKLLSKQNPYIEEINFLRHLSKKGNKAEIFGKSLVFNRNGYLSPFQNVKIRLDRLDKKQKTVETFTNDSGEYKFLNIDTGKYKITPILPKHYTTSNYDTKELIINSEECYEKNFDVRNNSLVSVKVVDPNRTPVKNIKVEFIRIDNKQWQNRSFLDQPSGFTNSEGILKLPYISQGRYLISINYLRGRGVFRR